MDGLETFFEFEDGALKKVVGDSRGGYGQTECEWDCEQLMPREDTHDGPMSAGTEDHPEKELVEEIEAVGDFSEIDECSRNAHLDVEDGQEQEGCSDEHKEKRNNEMRTRYGTESEQFTGFEPRGQSDCNEGSSPEE